MKSVISLRKIIFNLVLFLSAYYLGLTFISASLDKIVDPFDFSKAILNYEIMPYWTINLTAIVLPWLELICGLLLFIGVSISIMRNIKISFIDISNNIIILMLLWFIFILAIAHIRGGEELGREWYEDGKLFNKKNESNPCLLSPGDSVKFKSISKEEFEKLANE